MLRSLRFFLPAVLLASSLSAREPRWQELQIGHTAGQTVALLGEPLLRSKGRGFEKWTYDDGAEVIFHGALIGWTVPASLRAAARSDDIWKQWPELGYDAALRRAAPPEAPRSSKRKAIAAPAGVGFEEYLRG